MQFVGGLLTFLSLVIGLIEGFQVPSLESLGPLAPSNRLKGTVARHARATTTAEEERRRTAAKNGKDAGPEVFFGSSVSSPSDPSLPRELDVVQLPGVSTRPDLAVIKGFRTTVRDAEPLAQSYPEEAEGERGGQRGLIEVKTPRALRLSRRGERDYVEAQNAILNPLMLDERVQAEQMPAYYVVGSNSFLVNEDEVRAALREKQKQKRQGGAESPKFPGLPTPQPVAETAAVSFEKALQVDPRLQELYAAEYQGLKSSIYRNTLLVAASVAALLQTLTGLQTAALYVYGNIFGYLYLNLFCASVENIGGRKEVDIVKKSPAERLAASFANFRLVLPFLMMVLLALSRVQKESHFFDWGLWGPSVNLKALETILQTETFKWVDKEQFAPVVAGFVTHRIPFLFTTFVNQPRPEALLELARNASDAEAASRDQQLEKGGGTPSWVALETESALKERGRLGRLGGDPEFLEDEEAAQRRRDEKSKEVGERIAQIIGEFPPIKAYTAFENRISKWVGDQVESMMETPTQRATRLAEEMRKEYGYSDVRTEEEERERQAAEEAAAAMEEETEAEVMTKSPVVVFSGSSVLGRQSVFRKFLETRAGLFEAPLFVKPPPSLVLKNKFYDPLTSSTPPLIPPLMDRKVSRAVQNSDWVKKARTKTLTEKEWYSGQSQESVGKLDEIVLYLIVGSGEEGKGKGKRGGWRRRVKASGVKEDGEMEMEEEVFALRRRELADVFLGDKVPALDLSPDNLEVVRSLQETFSPVTLWITQPSEELIESKIRESVFGDLGIEDVKGEAGGDEDVVAPVALQRKGVTSKSEQLEALRRSVRAENKRAESSDLLDYFVFADDLDAACVEAEACFKEAVVERVVKEQEERKKRERERAKRKRKLKQMESKRELTPSSII
uniref:Guanylate kinase-like domain-containing protein n=1 Tax=Chromera velia CCMP2878 TaxID=1169474 RepID=A0A0G4H0H3_9ALVE|eukprot:Cvel_5481.t1-p1 / transcript=Cvel_5481.t1 / gene=Cvel_5481 / organism=Chromera_velia_CCMP2878 / gene_product=hypothetical protein / transcript_product=hypothetical protein / location=Cvel_scaffold256:72642-83580(-) / protein_length=901 / sequence_SO=supercontig / SO=protein_coding / is_pseudo=false